MLRHLHIRNFAIIDSLELAPGPGMNVLSGETGAGKSILIDALGLLLGDRASSDTVRAGCDRAELAVEFDLLRNNAALQWLSDNAMDDPDEPDVCRLRRVISRDGRGQQSINGSPCGVRDLATLGEYLLEIHGQHANQTLTRPDSQREILDAYATHANLLNKTAELARDWQETRSQIEALQDNAGDGGARLEFVQFQIQELEALALGENEIDELEAEHRTLSHGGELLEKGHAALARLYDDEGSAQSLLAEARRALQEVAGLDARFENIAASVETAEIAAKEAASDLRDLLEGTDLDPARLEWVDNRLSAIHSLARKHRVEDRELPGLLARLQEEESSLADADKKIAELETTLANLHKDYNKAADQLSASRSKAAGKLGKAIAGHLHELGMPDARMEIAVSPRTDSDPSVHGTDDIAFRISANPGQPLQPLSKVASGGELSRVSLAIQLESARLVGVPTMIFDEVDAGIGGRVAEMVGRSLSTLGKTIQVLCVTHLPQVAAQAGKQFQVRKEVSGGQTYTRIAPLSDTDRIEELARMLGGMEITEQTRAHAEEMIRKAG